ncbi:SDR family NAD(P)-dependent oxidoreductase [Brevibacillus dissolubilis]|uniref:SDR family NAD(P)-dependent oxidoreductase n=1 Tax=Brevibacillus dissolubilis TaxID=1844116 RepID=UPI0021005DA2|nr:SDR family NAD(P)-dependent oxidoreductase [Brevibacillus dissolubilis]
MITRKNPVVANHRVHGQDLLPGLAYIDLIYQVFCEHGFAYQELELKNVSIYHPLIVGQDDEIQLDIQCTQTQVGHWRIRIEGQTKTNGQLTEGPKQYATAEMVKGQATRFQEALDSQAWKQSAQSTMKLDDIYAQGRAKELVHTGFMKAEGQMYQKEEGMLIEISLGQEALPHAQAFLFHPTLIDGSGVGSAGMLSSLLEGEQRLYLPLFYESFRASEPLQKQCMTRIQTSSVRQEKELIYLTFEFFNQSGQKVAELKNFASKLVREADLIHPDRTSTPQPAAEGKKKDQPSSSRPNTNLPGTPSTGSINDIELFLQQLLAQQLNVPYDQVDPKAGFYDIGLDSPGLLGMVDAIGTKIGASLTPTLLFEYTTIAELAAYLANKYGAYFQASPTSAQEKEGAGHTAVSSATVATDAGSSHTSTDRYVSSDQNQSQNDEKLSSSHTARPTVEEDIAIIGMAGRYPQARNIQEFWQNLMEGKDCISEVPASRWDWKELEDLTSPSGKTLSKWGGFIDDQDCFDPQFFRISPREAEIMDPQERLFLETCWETIEDAGYTPKSLVKAQGQNKRRPVGVFVGVMHKDYSLVGTEAVSKENVFPLSLNYAQIANRVSYICNFHGPSMAVDTVCSSSLTALHLALESIRRGECEAALAGGVNLSLHPNKYISYNTGDMFASDGRCHTFGKGGDGYVSGEGVGAVLLKPLHKAVQDGDHIYAVIKGSAINHVGTVSGITVPSPVAQADVIESCLEKAGVDPRTISYIEAHGTGTSLGDPIEIQGLTKAFDLYTADKQFCSIGSVKSNIGHAESAAGISGLSKVALQLYHKTLVPSLHSEELNPYLDLPSTPFYVQQETQEWKQPVMIDNGQEIKLPRRAGISSFGASGSNAHIILEEYIPQPKRGDNTVPLISHAKPTLLPLSAKTKDRLQAYAEKLLAFLHDGINLADLAYTLQVGREPLEERVVFLAGDIQELKAKLKAFTEGQTAISDCWIGLVKNGKELTVPSGEHQHTHELVRTWMDNGNLQQIAESWVNGMSIDWNAIYGEHRPERISAPTYPFAKERYWVPEAPAKSNSKTITQVIHPLLHQNTSDFTEQRFSSTFTGQEFFLADHVVRGQKILPGVAYLEMARTAVEKATGAAEEDLSVIRLKDIVWIRPIIQTNQPVDVHIGLYAEDNGEISYEVYSESADADSGQVVHSQGSAVLGTRPDAHLTLDIRSLQAECNQLTVTQEDIYKAFHSMELGYGPGFQGIEKLYIGEKQLLARISLPVSVRNTQDQYLLHPSLMDSAFHTSVGFVLGAKEGDGAEARLSLPFAMEQLEIFGPCPAEMWSYVRYSEGSEAGDKVVKYDIDLCDEDGVIYVQMKGASIRAMEGGAQAEHTASETKTVKVEVIAADTTQPPVGNIMLLPTWEPISVELAPNAPASTERVVIVGGTEENHSIIQQYFPTAAALHLHPTDDISDIAKKLASYGAVDHMFWIAPHQPQSLSDEELLDEQNRGVIQLFRTVKAMLQLGYSDKRVSWSIITSQAQHVHKQDDVNPSHASLHGLAGTMAKEYPNWAIRLIDLEAGRPWPGHHIFTLPANRLGHAWAYRRGEWYQQQLVPFQHTPSASQSLYRTNGVYVVIGGAGYIGEAWSEYMIRHHQAQIIWIGRSAIHAGIQAKIDRLAALGPAPEYIAADASDLASMQQAYAKIKERHNEIHGIIQSAMVLNEQSLENMKVEEFQAGLAPKIAVSVRMAQVFGQEPLDFVLFFSSLVAYIKNVKQSHYATGCAFEDAFAHQLSKRWKCPVKVMNWGYWGDGSVAEDKEFAQLLGQIGLALIEPQAGMKALDVLLSGPIDQMALIHTSKPVTVEGMNPQEEITAYEAVSSLDIYKLEHQIPKKSVTAEQIKYAHNQEMDALLAKMLFAQLQTIGMFTEPKVAKADLASTYKLHALYDKWLDESIAVLLRYNYLKEEGDTYHVVNPTLMDMDTLWKEWEAQKAAWQEDSSTKASSILVDATLKSLPQILTGKVPATDIMFPDSSMRLVEGIYKHNPVADHFNDVLSSTVVAYLQERLAQDPAAKIRIFEIGAGTGGTSAGVFQKLKPYQQYVQEYCYTDLSRAFLMHAEKEYGPENPFLTYQIFNVEAPLAGQDIDAGGYDLVIAANVLHATKNIRQTLRNAKAVLKKGGLILLNEMAGNGLFTHLTFGLLEGWWLYEDPEIRIAGCPGLYPESWQQVLVGEGYDTVIFPAKEAHTLHHQIVVAQSDGVIRQKKVVHQQPISAARAKDTQAKATTASSAQSTAKPTSQADILLRDKVTTYIVKLVGETLKIPANRIDPSDPLEKYGIDSIVVVQLTNTLRKVLENVSSTLFFEHQSIDALVEHFIKTQKDALIKLVGLDQHEMNQAGSQSVETAAVETTDQSSSLPSQSRHKSRRFMKQTADAPVTGTASTAPASTVRDIAIIGMSGRYAQAKTVHEFWDNLRQGKNCITEIPKDRFDYNDYYDPQKGKRGTIYTKWGGFIEDYDKFDPAFFQISPVEAERMDPQERVFLEAAYASIEDAGYTPANLSASRKVGVFTGVMNKNYPTGYGYWSFANRISYLLNFQGPSLAVDTACSASLTAIHLALESLYSGTSEVAIAGGVNLVVDPIHYLNLSAMQMLSAGDKCKSFGDHADGFVDGEGVGAILLKPLDKAIADGDQIYGVIKGSMINAGGKTNGYTVPNPNAQYELITEALQRAGVPARTISYIEAHGTGTALGDPIEISGLTRAFERDTQDRQFCAIGSAKSNIGHCESAAGVAAVTKVLLQLKHRQIAPSLHSEVPNPNIHFSNTPFVVQHELGEWKRPVIDGQEVPRRAGISSFGAGGANAHLIIEEYIPQASATANQNNPNQPALIVLSAKNAERLQEQVERLLTAIQEQQWTDADLPRIAYTLQVGREAMEERLGVLAGSIQELIGKLKQFLDGSDYVDDLYRDHIKHNKNSLAVFAADEDTEKIIEAWISKGKYAKLLELWVKGLTFDWNKLYGSNKPLRTSLPTYPFARERYWLPESDAKGKGTRSRKAPNQLKGKLRAKLKGYATEAGNHTVGYSRDIQLPEAYELMTFAENWTEQSLTETTATKINTLLCFLTDPENQKTVEEAVHTFDSQTKVIFIAQGQVYQKESDRVYSISRNGLNSYAEAFASIQADHGEPDAILYLWTLEDAGCIQDYSCIAHILKSIGHANWKPKRLLLAGAYENGLDRCYAESWIGFERSLGLALPNTKVSAVYQVAGHVNPADTVRDWAHILWAELQAPKAESVLYEGGKRYVSTIEPTIVEQGENLLRPEATYLITGGCGGLGYLFAKHLAANYSANLILTGRSPMDADKQAQVKALEELGGQVMYVQADVCDSACMEEGLNEAKKRFGAIHGVIHAAGVVSSQNLFEKDMQGFQEIIDPKVNGTMLLDELLQAETLDFVCYFSSSAAILGDFGSCDYAIGNRFQMAYARYRNEQQGQGKTFVINWPVWKDGGMGIGDEKTTEMYLKSSGQRFLETEEGIAVFERILSQDQAQHLIIVGQRSRANRFLGLAEQSSAHEMVRETEHEHVETTTVPVVTTPAGAGRRAEMQGLSIEQCIEWDLQEHIYQLLKIPKHKLEPDMNWSDFGFDSINLAEFASILSKHYGIEVTPAVFFGYSTIEKLIRYYMADHRVAMEEFYRVGVTEQVEQVVVKKATAPAPAAQQVSGKAVNSDAVGKAKSVPAVSSANMGTSGQPTASAVQATPLAPATSGSPAPTHQPAYPAVTEPIAIIGMSGRFPQADNITELWNNLKNGKSCITEVPAERWDWREYFGDPLQEAGKTNSRWGAFLKDVDRFDPLFFQISPKEAENMDPRHRIFLQEAWRTFEDAGYMGERIKGMSCGVYVGVEEGEYAFMAGDDMKINGSQNATLSARIAYALDLKGPNLALTAACSSGLVAIHQACLALRQGDCEMALVGGVSLNISHMSFAALSKAEMLSPDGQCRVFDTRANGLVPGEAVAAVLLKPLSKAIADNDHIYGCIKASGVNYDGRTNGITSPNPFSQQELIEGIYDKYQINPLDIQYVMAHSTGSKLGDPLEVQALTSAFRKYTDQKQFCTLGSIKPLIGHTFAASGVVGVISMLMAMRDQLIPATYNSEVNNEYINFKDSPFTLIKENQTWVNKNNQPRLGTVSSTGISGTNAHVVVEEYVPITTDTNRAPADPTPQIVVLSAKDQDSLQAVVGQMLDFAEHQTELSIPNLAYTLQVGREAMESRLAMVASSKQELISGLREYLRAVKEGRLQAGQALQAGVPIFTGDQDEDDSHSGSLLSRTAGESLLQVLIQEKKWDAIAQVWAEGGKVAWEALHEGSSVRRIPLPTYPFKRERYWLTVNKQKQQATEAVQPSAAAAQEPQVPGTAQATQVQAVPPTSHMTEVSQKQQAATSDQAATPDRTAAAQHIIQQYIIPFLSEELSLAPSQINVKKKLQDYGMDSILGRKLVRHLEECLHTKITGREMLEYRTVHALATHLAEKVDAAIIATAPPQQPVNPANPAAAVQHQPSASSVATLEKPAYSDMEIIELMEKYTRGELSFENVQKMIEGIK